MADYFFVFLFFGLKTDLETVRKHSETVMQKSVLSNG